MEMDVNLISGGLHVDQRGIVSFVNDFDFQGVDRFYTIRAHAVGEPRGWIGHRKEQKWFTALSGTVLVAVVAPDQWESPASNLPVERYVLSALKPTVLHVPAGHATASVMLSPDAHLGIFSSGKIAEAGKDDWRFDVGTWDVKS
jgi:dTDP-4-dehydrorhamnose 3,5-epimerase